MKCFWEIFGVISVSQAEAFLLIRRWYRGAVSTKASNIPTQPQFSIERLGSYDTDVRSYGILYTAFARHHGQVSLAGASAGNAYAQRRRQRQKPLGSERFCEYILLLSRIPAPASDIHCPFDRLTVGSLVLVPLCAKSKCSHM